MVTLDQVLALPRDEQGHTIQIYEGLYLAPLDMEEPADCVNHYCNPNAGIHGQISLVAMREIAARLSISEETVRSHMKEILARLGVRNRTEGVARYLKMKDQQRAPS